MDSAKNEVAPRQLLSVTDGVFLVAGAPVELEPEQRARIGYYNVNGVPDGYLDGTTRVSRTQSAFRTQVRTRGAVPAPGAAPVA